MAQDLPATKAVTFLGTADMAGSFLLVVRCSLNSLHENVSLRPVKYLLSIEQSANKASVVKYLLSIERSANETSAVEYMLSIKLLANNALAVKYLLSIKQSANKVLAVKYLL